MSPFQKMIRLFILYSLTGVVLLANATYTQDDHSEGHSRLDLIPKTIGAWQGMDLDKENALDTFYLKDAGAFRYLVRHYKQRKDGPVIILSALEDLNGTQRDIHDPRLCYESRGWTVLKHQEHKIQTKRHDFGNMKLISYTNKSASIRRMEIFGYLADKEMIISEIELRFTHILNRLKGMIGKQPATIVYINVSTDINDDIAEEQRLKEIEYIMGEVLSILTVKT